MLKNLSFIAELYNAAVTWSRGGCGRYVR